MVPHELSLVLQNEIIRARFMADPDLVGGLMNRLGDVQHQAINAKGVSLQDFQVRPLDQEHVGTATQWVHDVSFAVGLDVAKPAPEGDEEAWQRWQSLLAAAQQVQDSVEEPGAIPQFLIVEFVWDNGGGDDNLFTQGFWTNKADGETVSAFQEALEAIKNDDGPFYDLSWYGPDDLTVGESLDDLSEKLSPFKAQVPLLFEMISNLRSIERSHQLSEQLPAPPAPRRAGPRF